jgi:hypothetical protein
MIGYRDPAHWSKQPLAARCEFVKDEGVALDLRATWKQDGLRVRVTKLVNYKRQDGTKVYYWKVEGFDKPKAQR